MTPLWLAVLDEDPGAEVSAHLRDEQGRPAGVLCLWHGAGRPHEAALQADPRAYDSAGPPCTVSLALAAPGARPIADDPALVHARRDVLRDGRPCAVTMLTAGPVLVAGSLTVARSDRPEQVVGLRDDPFARLWRSRLLQVGPHVLGAAVRPSGPSLERYSGAPWPFDRFASP